MTTATLQEAPVEAQTESTTKLTRAERKYRAAVWAAVEDGVDVSETIRDAAERLQSDIDADVQTYRDRIEALRVISEDVPIVEAEVEKIAKAARQERSFGTRPVTDFQTVNQLFLALREVGWQADPHYVSPTERAAREKRSDAERMRSRAIERLASTADFANTQAEIAIRGRATGLNNRLASLRETLLLPGLIRQQVELLAGIAAGRVLTPHGHSPKTFLAAERRRLAEMRARLPEVEKAERGIPETEAELRELAGKREALEAERLTPKCMRWSGVDD